MSAVADEKSAAEERVRLVMEAEANADSSPDVEVKDIKQMELGGRPFPLSMIIGQDSIKQALLLSSINNRMGGVVISGGKGTAKSVMARALHQLLPPIEVIKGSPFNIDPEGEFGLDDFTKTDLDNGGTPLSERETEIIPCPFVQVPLNVMEDRLIGSADLEESVKNGKTVFSPGILARAHRGVLYVDDINLLDEETANILLGVVQDGFVNVEREGISLRYPCKPLLIATFNPDEGELRDHLLDRIAVALSADAQKLDIGQRVEAVESVLGFASSGAQKTDAAQTALDEAISNEDDLKTAIVFAREFIKDVKVASTQTQYLCEEAIRAGCQGHRAEIFAVEVARASAALEGRSVNSEDLRLAVKLAIAPRGTFINSPQDPDEMTQPPPPPPPPQMDQQSDDTDEDEEDEEDKEEEDQEEEEEEDDEDRDDTPDVPEVPQEFMFDADSTPVDPDLMAFSSRERGGKGGGRGLIFSQDRGRYIKPMLPKGKVVRLAVDATLRAAAPYQKSRRERAIGTKKEERGVHIEQGDVRTKKMARKAGSLIIFVVDASGSMALNRMNAAKGAAVSLLTEAYQSRDMISLIPFQGEAADVLLPPTKSITMARKRLEQMPCGGGSPLAHALQVSSAIQYVISLSTYDDDMIESNLFLFCL
jgi:magnesium chelatase subunit D